MLVSVRIREHQHVGFVRPVISDKDSTRDSLSTRFQHEIFPTTEINYIADGVWMVARGSLQDHWGYGNPNVNIFLKPGHLR